MSKHLLLFCFHDRMRRVNVFRPRQGATQRLQYTITQVFKITASGRPYNAQVDLFNFFVNSKIKVNENILFYQTTNGITSIPQICNDMLPFEPKDVLIPWYMLRSVVRILQI